MKPQKDLEDFEILLLAQSLSRAVQKRDFLENHSRQIINELNLVKNSEVNDLSNTLGDLLTNKAKLTQQLYQEKRNARRFFSNFSDKKNVDNQISKLQFEIEQINKSLNFFQFKYGTEVNEFHRKTRMLKGELGKFRRDNREDLLIIEMYSQKVQFLSAVSLTIDDIPQSFDLLPNRFSFLSDKSCVSPSSELGKVILGLKKGQSAQLKESSFENKYVHILSTNLPNPDLLTKLLEHLNQRQDNNRFLHTFQRNLDSGRWRDHGRENDIIVWCTDCGNHGLYAHNPGCPA